MFGSTLGLINDSICIMIGHDIYLIDRSDINTGSYTNFGRSYALPSVKSSEDRTSFLAGNFDNWLTTEIEVYQLRP
jgi:hypothetical protein